MITKTIIDERLARADRKRTSASEKSMVDKTGYFYHAITKTFDNGTVFYKDVADYRHNMLCNLCEERGITILFSVTMQNHTHDIFLTPDWNLLSETLRILDLNLSKQLRRRYPKRFKKGVRVFRRHPTYVVIRDIKTLFYEGKYVYDNPEYLKKANKLVPHSCFWMFENGYFATAYDETLYRKLFDLDPKELADLYQKLSKDEVRKYAAEHFSNWTEEMNRQTFYK